MPARSRIARFPRAPAPSFRDPASAIDLIVVSPCFPCWGCASPSEPLDPAELFAAWCAANNSAGSSGSEGDAHPQQGKQGETTIKSIADAGSRNDGDRKSVV